MNQTMIALIQIFSELVQYHVEIFVLPWLFQRKSFLGYNKALKLDLLFSSLVKPIMFLISNICKSES